MKFNVDKKKFISSALSVVLGLGCGISVMAIKDDVSRTDSFSNKTSVEQKAKETKKETKKDNKTNNKTNKKTSKNKSKSKYNGSSSSSSSSSSSNKPSSQSKTLTQEEIDKDPYNTKHQHWKHTDKWETIEGWFITQMHNYGATTFYTKDPKTQKVSTYKLYYDFGTYPSTEIYRAIESKALAEARKMPNFKDVSGTNPEGKYVSGFWYKCYGYIGDRCSCGLVRYDRYDPKTRTKSNQYGGGTWGKDYKEYLNPLPGNYPELTVDNTTIEIVQIS